MSDETTTPEVDPMAVPTPETPVEPAMPAEPTPETPVEPVAPPTAE